MAKTNFTKVESLLEKGMEKRLVEKLIVETGGKKKGLGSNPKLYLIESLHWDVMVLPDLDKKFFKKLGVSKKDIFKLIKNPASLTDKDWQIVKDIRAKIDVLKKEILKKASTSNEELIEHERKRHVNKRFNVNERWLPLQ